jgi:hypothetical protein
LAGLSTQPFSQTAILVNADFVIPAVIKFLSDADTVNTARYAATVLANMLQIDDKECVREIRAKVFEYDGASALLNLVLLTKTPETIRKACQALIVLDFVSKIPVDIFEKLKGHSCYQIRLYVKLLCGEENKNYD